MHGELIKLSYRSTRELMWELFVAHLPKHHHQHEPVMRGSIAGRPVERIRSMSSLSPFMHAFKVEYVGRVYMSPTSAC